MAVIRRRRTTATRSCCSYILLILSIQLALFSASNEEPVCQGGSQDGSCEPPWRLTDDHPCNIPILTPAGVLDTFGPDGFPTFYSEPVIVRDPSSNLQYKELTSRQNVASLTGESINLPMANLYTFATEQTSIEDFLNAPETLSTSEAGKKLYFLQNIGANIKDYYALPRTTATAKDQRLGLGVLGSGAQWHMHGPGFCDILHGRKLWLLYGKERPFYNTTYASRHWMENYYHLKDHHPTETKLWQCTTQPGDAIYFPNKWYHTTVNLDNYVAFVTSFFDIADLNADRRAAK